MTEEKVAEEYYNLNTFSEIDNVLEERPKNSSAKFPSIEKCKNLKVLRVDNNRIHSLVDQEEISAGLKSLTNLMWLDLSFNEIEKICGLENLVHLKDLSFFENRIEKIEGLKSLKKLEVISLGNNLIESIDEMRKLRKIDSLRAVNFAGNPMWDGKEAKSYALAFIPQIKYLNNLRVFEKERKEAKEQFQDELVTLEEDERSLNEEKFKDKEREKYLQKVRDCKMINVEELYSILFNKEVEEVLNELFASYETECRKLIDLVMEKSYKAHDAFVREMKSYEIESNEIKQKMSQNVKIGHETKFDDGESKKLILEEVDWLLKALDQFEDRCKNIRTERNDIVQECFRGIEDLQNSYFQQVIDICYKIENTSKEELQNGHDEAIELILAKEEETRTEIDCFFNDIFTTEKDKHLDRKRHKLKEVERIVKELADLKTGDVLDVFHTFQP
eukprot:snap_masked-scaffold_8-processed-gene-6.36-mRNA-1 protein AED:0.29 eAED:0.29 QI:0/0/0/0.5/1/1/2/0/445